MVELEYENSEEEDDDDEGIEETYEDGTVVVLLGSSVVVTLGDTVDTGALVVEFGAIIDEETDVSVTVECNRDVVDEDVDEISKVVGDVVLIDG